ncbi:hypothetical protein SI65_06137 [Aspergillus cristatus]|uniref:DUF7514 domain-containing protein n=1 Tax=Aspergillus cristatus TaxID=573508 RepID=A0A1E3BD01_ASPCR|nr:hypothetical protein SI65_06137 [Aspergillus cristatus]
MSFNDRYFWGPLINADKSPAPLLEQLCLGIAELMISFHDCGTTDLTPERLAAFYHKVGGNYDPLFLETKPAALSFIYQSLGCFHSLQPSTNAFEPPSLPALLPSGFVRWQTIQILLDPNEHVRYLQNAVRMWDIRNPFGGFFPKSLPRDSFPPGPDMEMIQWHEQVSRRLEYDYLKRSLPRSPPPPFSEQYQHRFLPSQSALVPVRKEEPEEDRALVRTKNRTVPQYRYVEANDTPPRAPNGRRTSAEHPPPPSHNMPPRLSPPPEIKPRAPSPPVWPEQPARSRRRQRASSIPEPVVPEAMPGYYPSDVSSEPQSPEPEPSPRYHRRYLSPHRGSRARRHSHDAYSRKPPRDLSPDYPRHYTPQHSHRHSGGWHDANVPPRVHWAYKDEIPPPKHSGVRFREYPSEEPVTVPSSPESPVFVPVHPRYASSGYMPPHAPDPIEDPRRRSYSGGSLPERPRFAGPGVGPWPPQAPVRMYPAQGPPTAYVPVPVPDVEYIDTA